MKPVIKYIHNYFLYVNKTVLLLTTIFAAILIYFNYRHDLETVVTSQQSLWWPGFTGHYIIFLSAFTIPYLLYLIVERKNFFSNKLFLLLLVTAPALFALKMEMNTTINASNDVLTDHYWNQIVYWPLRVITLTILLFICWRLYYPEESFFGVTTKQFSWTPYFIMLLIMIPLIAAASTQHDFLQQYPKLNEVILPPHLTPAWLYKLLFELSYGSDFFSIELFFRGFLVLAFAKYAGKDVILPMACFYCTIHFGKPLGECISSYFGGALLGIVVYNTKSIFGGLVVHLGIAWMMEVGGAIGGMLNA